MVIKKLLSGVILFMMMFFVGHAAENFSETGKVFSNENTRLEHFGSSSAIDGNYGVVGAPTNDDNGLHSGAAYVLEKDSSNSWSVQTQLLASDGQANYRFGRSVDVSGDYIIVGSHDANSSGVKSGAAYIFKRDGNTWVEQQKLVPSDPIEKARFGFSVSIDGDYAVVGTYESSDSSGSKLGGAYVFKRNGDTWTQVQKLSGSTAVIYESFGWSTAIEGDYIAVSAIGRHYNSGQPGSIYIFKRNSGDIWVEQTELQYSPDTSSVRFGDSISMNENYLITNSFISQGGVLNSGYAHIFKRDGNSWIKEATLVANETLPLDYFGKSVSINSDYAVVGTDGRDDRGENSGAAYVFKRNGTSWQEDQKLHAFDGVLNDRFGSSVALNDNNQLLVGSVISDGTIPNTGAVYTFSVLANNNSNSGNSTSGNNSTGGGNNQNSSNNGNTQAEVIITSGVVTIDAPALVQFGTFSMSSSEQIVEVNLSSPDYFSVRDLKADPNGYYTTLSVSDLVDGSKSIVSSQMETKVHNGVVTTLAGLSNSDVVAPTQSYSTFTSTSPITLIERSVDSNGVGGEYGVLPSFKLVIPAYQPIGTYTGTITYTLIEN